MPKKVTSHDYAVRMLRDLGTLREIPQQRRKEVTQQLIAFAKQIRSLPLPEEQQQQISVRAMEAIFFIGERDPESAKLLRGIAEEVRVARKLYGDYQVMASSPTADGMGRGGMRFSPGTGGRDELTREDTLRYEGDVDITKRDLDLRDTQDKDWDWYRWKYYREGKRIDEKYELGSADLRNADRSDDTQLDSRLRTEALNREIEDQLNNDEVNVRPEGDRSLRDDQQRILRVDRERRMREAERRRMIEEERMRALEAERLRSSNGGGGYVDDSHDSSYDDGHGGSYDDYGRSDLLRDDLTRDEIIRDTGYYDRDYDPNDDY